MSKANSIECELLEKPGYKRNLAFLKGTKPKNLEDFIPIRETPIINEKPCKIKRLPSNSVSEGKYGKFSFGGQGETNKKSKQKKCNRKRKFLQIMPFPEEIIAVEEQTFPEKKPKSQFETFIMDDEQDPQQQARKEIICGGLLTKKKKIQDFL